MTHHQQKDVPLLVTGADGRVGRLLRAAWAGQPPTNILPFWCGRKRGHWQDLLAGPLDPVPARAFVLHLAADLSGDADAGSRSVAMAEAVAVAARRGRARGILFVSTAAVYGPADHDLDEASPCQPTTPYGHAKVAAESTCRRAAGAVPVTVLRIGNVVGAGALIGAARGAGKVELDPVPGQPGGPMRSWIAPGELARLLCRLVGLADLPDVLNLAGPKAFTMADMLDAAGCPWIYGPYRPQLLPRLTLDTSRLAALCPDLAARTPLEMMDDLRRTLVHRVSA